MFSDEVSPDEVTAALQIEPTESWRKGDEHSRGKLRRKSHGWFLSAGGKSDSRFHLDLILNALTGKELVLRNLQARGCELDITHLWFFIGHGGPERWPEQMSRLGAFGLAIWWDIYFDSEVSENVRTRPDDPSSRGRSTETEHF